MEDHFIYVRGYPEPIPIGNDDEMRVRNALIGERFQEYLSVVTQNKKLLIRISDVSVLESRPKVAA